MTDTCPNCAKLQAELDRVKAMLGPVADAEFSRRVELLIDRARRVEFGKMLCPVCSKQKITKGKLRGHLKAAHREEILAAHL